MLYYYKLSLNTMTLKQLFLFITCVSNNPSMSIHHIYTLESLLGWKQGIATPWKTPAEKTGRASEAKSQPSIQPCVLQCSSWPWQLDRSSCSSRWRPLGAHRGTDPHTHSGIWSLSADRRTRRSREFPNISACTYCNKESLPKSWTFQPTVIF